eukprot:3443028-Rhodomonas_salina.1
MAIAGRRSRRARSIWTQRRLSPGPRDRGGRGGSLDRYDNRGCGRSPGGYRRGGRDRWDDRYRVGDRSRGGYREHGGDRERGGDRTLRYRHGEPVQCDLCGGNHYFWSRKTGEGCPFRDEAMATFR